MLLFPRSHGESQEQNQLLARHDEMSRALESLSTELNAVLRGETPRPSPSLEALQMENASLRAELENNKQGERS